MRFTLRLFALLMMFNAFSAWAENPNISSLGRLEPQNGIIQLAAPSNSGLSGAVIRELLVAEGDRVTKGQVLARLDSYELRAAEVKRIEAILKNAKKSITRQQNLAQKSLASATKLDDTTMDYEIAIAELAAARANLDLSEVKSPLSGQVLEIHTHPGERTGSDGILDLAATDRMYAIAEVYETDIAKVQVGQQATVSAPALATPLTGQVERIGLKVGRLDVIGTDPVAKTDARVVEVFVVLDDSEAVAHLTNMQVEVEIQP